MGDWVAANTDKLAGLADLASIGSFIAVVFAGVALFLESRRFQRTLVLGVHGQLFNSNFNVLAQFLEKPALRQYFYEGQELPDDPDVGNKVQVLCEIVADHFELVCLQMKGLQNEATWRGWTAYMTDLISRSPALREHFISTAEWVTEPIYQGVITQGFLRARLLPPLFAERPPLKPAA